MLAHINLLPPNKKKDLRRTFVLSHALSLSAVISLFAVVITLTLGGVYMQLYSNEQTMQVSNDPSSNEYESLTLEITAMNEYSKRLHETLEDRQNWSNLFKEIGSMVPDKVGLERVSVNRDGHLTIAGFGLTRESVLDFKASLAASDKFTEVRLPLDNLLQKTDVRFEFDITMAGAPAPEPKKEKK